jgi:hypothetical protein
MSSMQSPPDRYLHEPAFSALTDTLVELILERMWSYGDFHSAWALAERKAYEIKLASTGDASE